MVHVSMESDELRRARENRTGWAVVFFLIGLAIAIAGVAKWSSTKPDLNASAKNVVTALGQVEGGSGSPHYIESQPMWAYGGLAVAAVFVVIALILLATRPHAPARAWTDARA